LSGTPNVEWLHRRTGVAKVCTFCDVFPGSVPISQVRIRPPSGPEACSGPAHAAAPQPPTRAAIGPPSGKGATNPEVISIDGPDSERRAAPVTYMRTIWQRRTGGSCWSRRSKITSGFVAPFPDGGPIGGSGWGLRRGSMSGSEHASGPLGGRILTCYWDGTGKYITKSANLCDPVRLCKPLHVRVPDNVSLHYMPSVELPSEPDGRPGGGPRARGERPSRTGAGRVVHASGRAAATRPPCAEPLALATPDRSSA